MVDKNYPMTIPEKFKVKRQSRPIALTLPIYSDLAEYGMNIKHLTETAIIED